MFVSSRQASDLWHCDIDLCVASLRTCACVHVFTHAQAIIGIQISSHKYAQLLPFFNRESQSQGLNSMMGNKLKRVALITHIRNKQMEVI